MSKKLDFMNCRGRRPRRPGSNNDMISYTFRRSRNIFKRAVEGASPYKRVYRQSAGEPKGSPQIVEKVFSNVEVYPNAPQPKAPLCKGGCQFVFSKHKLTGGLYCTILRICIGFRRKGNILLRQSLSQNRFRSADFASSLYTRDP